MRKIEDVLFGFVLTIFFFLNTWGLVTRALFDEQLSLWILTFRIGLSIATIVGVIGCFVDGRKNDENDPWSEIKKESGRKAYCLFVVGVLLMFPFAAAFSNRHWILGVIFLGIATALLIFGASNIETMTEYIKVITPAELRKKIRHEIADYRVINKSAIFYRVFGDGYEVTVKMAKSETKIVLDDNALDMTWFTTSGRTVKLYKVDQWAIVVFDCPRRVEVYESKVHPS